MNELIKAFANDPGVKLVAGLILADFVLGVSAAFVHRTFQIGWLSDFLRKDVMGKVVPFFGVWAAVRLGGDIEIGGYGMIEEGVNGAVIAALGASIVKSIADLKADWSAPKLVQHSDDPPPQP